MVRRCATVVSATRRLPLHLWGTIHVGKTKVFILDLERVLLKKKPGGKNLEVGPAVGVEVGMAWYADARR